MADRLSCGQFISHRRRKLRLPDRCEQSSPLTPLPGLGDRSNPLATGHGCPTHRRGPPHRGQPRLCHSGLRRTPRVRPLWIHGHGGFHPRWTRTMASSTAHYRNGVRSQFISCSRRRTAHPTHRPRQSLVLDCPEDGRRLSGVALGTTGYATRLRHSGAVAPSRTQGFGGPGNHFSDGTRPRHRCGALAHSRPRPHHLHFTRFRRRPTGRCQLDHRGRSRRRPHRTPRV